MTKFLLDNLNWFFDGIGVALGGSLIVWIYRSITLWNDGNAIFNWLKVNTKNEPNKSHKTLSEISIGTRLSEARAKKACLQNKKILQSFKKPGNYSIWCVEPLEIVQIFM